MASDPANYKEGDFLTPRYGTKGPLPLGVFSMIGPVGVSYANYLGPLHQMEVASVNLGVAGASRSSLVV